MKLFKMIDVATVLLFGCIAAVQGCRFDSDCGNAGCNECFGSEWSLFRGWTLGECRPDNIGNTCCTGGAFGTCRAFGTRGACIPSQRKLLGADEPFTARRLQDEEECECGLDDVCDDPHMKGLRGQQIDWSGVNGGWYNMIKDDTSDLFINVRLTAPLPDEFPDRQLITGISILVDGQSLVIEAKNPYTVDTGGCPQGVSPCLANGGLRAVLNGKEVDGLLRSSRRVPVADGLIVMSASNLPVECRQFGGHKIWARMYEEMLQQGRRSLVTADEAFENWILTFDNMAAPGWCVKYVEENDLADLQSNHAVFKIETHAVSVRLNAGVNSQGGGEQDWDGRVLPDLEFWQMDVGVEGLDVESPTLSGILGETARPVYDEAGNAVMEGFEALRGDVEDYRVSGPLGTHFTLLGTQKEGHE